MQLLVIKQKLKNNIISIKIINNITTKNEIQKNNTNRKEEKKDHPQSEKESLGKSIFDFISILDSITAIISKNNIYEKINELSFSLKNLMSKQNVKENINKNNEIIIGVDFGSTQSGYQIFYNSEIVFEGNKNNKILPTELIFDNYFKKGLSIGEQAKYFPKENIEKENKLYFSKFKRNLDPKINSNMVNASIPVGKQIENDIVITEYLRLLKDYIINNEEKINYTNIKDVKWVLAVPPLWDDNAKSKMKELAMKAEMSNVQIALEPEVDSLALFYDKNIKRELLKPGTSFLIVDMGGYTVDFTAMKILDENKNLEQLLQPVSFDFGSNLINEKIIDIIEKAYGKEKLEKVKKTNYRLWEKTLDEIEEKKKQINNEAKNFRISIHFNEAKFNDSYDFCTLNYNGFDIPYTSQYIDIPANLVLEIINELTNKIIENIKDCFFNCAEQIKFNYIHRRIQQ